MDQNLPLDYKSVRQNSVIVLKQTDESSEESDHKRKRFHPLRTVIHIFKRKKKPLIKEDDDSNMSTLKSRSTSELLAADDEERNRSSANSGHLGAGLSVSHDSVFNPERKDENNIRNVQSIQNLAMQKELIDRFQPQRDSDEDDIGLPYSPCTSPTTAEVLQQGLREASVKSHSVCSDGSLLSMGSSENDEDSSGALLLYHPRFSSDRRSEQDMDVEEGASFPLSHKAAHHKISVRPKKTHAVGRHRKLQQLTVASLPATPEDIEESRGNSPDHSWPTIGEGAYSSDSISRTSSAMSISDSTSSLSTGTSPTPKKILINLSSETLDIPHRSQQSAVERKIKQKNENVSRRRTVSESPSKDYETSGKDFTQTETRSHSLTVAELQEISKMTMPWVEHLKDSKPSTSDTKDIQSLSPIDTDLQKLDSPKPMKVNSFKLISRPEEESLNKTPLSCGMQPPEASEGPSVDRNISISKRFSNTISNEKEKPTVLTQEYVHRDLSYRLAVEEGERDENTDKNITKTKHKNVKEQSSSLFSFSSKSKKSDDLTKDKGKDKKEQKLKKDDKKDIRKETKEKKEDSDSPFFSRIWNSRRNSKRKKEKSELESDISHKDNSATQAEINKSTNGGSPVSTVDVKAMIQNLSAQSASTNSMKDKRSPKQLPKRFYRKSEALSAESGNFSKSLESISGPQSLNSPITINYDNQISGNKLSGSMPRLNIKKDDKISHELKGDASSDHVMMVEGEIVRLRKKIFSKEDTKPSTSFIEKPNKLSKTNKKEKREPRSFASWHGKKDLDSSVSLQSTSQDSKISTHSPETKKIPKSGLFHKNTEKKNAQQQGIHVDNNSVFEDKNKTSIDNGIANRFSGFWSSTISNIKSDFFHKDESEQIHRANSVKNIPSSSYYGTSESKEGHESSEETRTSHTNQLHQTSTLDEKVPEFLRIQLHRVKPPSETQLEPSTTSSQIEKQTIKSPTKRHCLEIEQISQKEQKENNNVIKSSVETKKKSVSNETTESREIMKKPEIEISSREEPLTSNKDANKTSVAEAPTKCLSPSKKENENESELMKVFHRRSLKIKDTSKDSASKSSQQEAHDKGNDKKKSDASIAKSSGKSENKNNSSGIESLQTGLPESENISYKSGMADKRSISLCQETLPSPRVRTNTSPSVALIASTSDVSKCVDKSENDVPEWRKIAQQRREQREQRERKVVTGNGHNDSSLILQSAPKHSGRSKVLDMVSNFQKLQVS